MAGTESKPATSGGQGKHVSIGLELVPMPSTMIMDEPTSDLNAATAVIIVKCSSQLKTTGLTITVVDVRCLSFLGEADSEDVRPKSVLGAARGGIGFRLAEGKTKLTG